MLPIPSDHSLYLVKIVEFQLSWGKLAPYLVRAPYNRRGVGLASRLWRRAGGHDSKPKFCPRDSELMKFRCYFVVYRL